MLFRAIVECCLYFADTVESKAEYEQCQERVHMNANYKWITVVERNKPVES